MKKTLIAFTTLMVTYVFAQKVQAQKNETAEKTTFGIRAGINFQNINGKDENDNKLDNKLITGFNAGINAEIPLASDFYFQPGLLFSTKGAKEDFGTSTATINLNYLELPLNLIYKAGIGISNVLLGFGPYAAYGLGGKVKGGGESVDVKFKKNADLNDDAFYVKPIDAGVNLLIGYEFTQKVSAQLNAQLGLANLNAYDTKDKLHNTGFGVSVGYRF